MAEKKKRKPKAPSGFKPGMNITDFDARPRLTPKLPAAGSFPMSGQGAGSYLYGSGNLNDPNRVMVQPAAAPLPETPGPDLMAMYNQLLSTLAGPEPTMAFDASPYAQGINQAQRQAQLGQKTINEGGQALMQQLGQLRSQWEGRNAEDMALIQGTQGKALAQAQGGINPVLADLQAQGVNVAGVQQAANQRVGTMQDQAALQNMLSQRTTQNVGNTLDATQRGAVTQGAGALNTLATNLSTTVNAIGQQQAKAQAAAQNQYLADLSAYNKNRMGAGTSILSMLGKQDSTAGDPVETVRSHWATQEGVTADKVNEALGYLDTPDFSSVDDIIGDLNKKDIDDPDNPGQKIDTWEQWRREGVNVNTVKAALREAAKKPKTDANATLINQLLGMK